MALSLLCFCLFVWSVCSWIIYFRFELDEETSTVNTVASPSVCDDVPFVMTQQTDLVRKNLCFVLQMRTVPNSLELFHCIYFLFPIQIKVD